MRRKPTLEERLTALELAINSDPNRPNEAQRWLDHVIDTEDQRAAAAQVAELRCKTCGWPLTEEPGCTTDSCSYREQKP